METKTLYIMQGVSGSGKSFIAQILEEALNDAVILSTDDFWMIDGTYEFDVSRLAFAHQWNKNRCEAAMAEMKMNIIIDNTNIKKKECSKYVDMADDYGYEVRFITVGCDISVSKEYNKKRPKDRKIPEVVIDRQYLNMERLF